jgi:DNA-binding CsgD family transcriptional regulator
MKTKRIKKAPGWLGLNEDKTAFVYLDDRAKIVQRIFQMSIRGTGGYTIAKLLNEAGVPAFGTSGKWDQSTIHNMLSSRATIGEYQKKQTINGKEVPVGKPIPHYYPAVIDLGTFEAAQEIRRENLSTRRGRKGRRITNLFSDIPRCVYCDSTVKLHNAKVKSLVCKQVWGRQGCYRFKWTYADFEKTLLEQLLALDPSLRPHLDPLWQTPSDDDQVIYQARMAASQHVRSKVSSLKIAFAGQKPDSSSSGVIRRDHPDRFFELILADGRAHIGRPAPIHKDQPRRVNPAKICEQLGLSQRQGLITALLADGAALNTIAEEVGMSISTARWHLREIFKRTRCHSQAELIDVARGALLST